MHLFIAEQFILVIISALYLIDVILVIYKGVEVDLVGYFLSLSAGVLLLLTGYIYRRLKRSPNLSASLVSSGLFILFSIGASVLNYMLLPVDSSNVDHALIKLDAQLGYDWQALVIWAASHPGVGTLLYYVYISSLPQLAVIMILLGFLGYRQRLHRFLMAGVIGAIASISVWSVFPSFGTTPYVALPSWVMEAIPLAVDPAYGQELIKLGREGVSYLSPANVLGLIGFPSFHIFMAAMSVRFVPRYTATIVVAWALNILMIPATLVQGGHHLADVFGGLILFAIICPLSSKLLDWMARLEERQSTPASSPAV